MVEKLLEEEMLAKCQRSKEDNRTPFFYTGLDKKYIAIYTYVCSSHSFLYHYI